MSSQQSRKKKTGMDREMEMESARIFGKHVSREKGRVLLAVTLIACALPMLLGARMWDAIPEIVPSGLIGADGKDDSIPRWMVAYGLPAFMCLMDLIAHGQLLLHQKRMTLPPTPVRLMGRWGFPVLSVVCCSGMILESTGRSPLELPFVTPCVLGLLLLILGAHMWDCPRSARIALRFPAVEHSDEAWRAVHRFAGWLWMAAGLLVIAGVMLTAASTPITAVLIVVALAAPMVYARAQESRGL